MTDATVPTTNKLTIGWHLHIVTAASSFLEFSRGTGALSIYLAFIGIEIRRHLKVSILYIILHILYRKKITVAINILKIY